MMAVSAERRWCVVGGADKGGILVRTAPETSSPVAPSRLATGALLREERVEGNRLEYTKLMGEGPETGWVTIKLNEKVLLDPAPIFEPKPAVAGREAGVFAEAASAAPSSRKIRVLCLHGTASSPRVMSNQLAILMKRAREDIEFVFAEGCIICSESNPIVAKQIKTMKQYYSNETFRQWGEPLGEQLGWRRYDGLDLACHTVQDVLKKEAPIDAVLGFSQGANVAHIVAAQAALGKGAPFRCVVHMCTAKPGWVDQMPELFEWKLPVPALIIEAEKDMIAIGSNEIALGYETSERAKHTDEHRPLPGQLDEAKALSDLIKAFLVKHCRE